MPLEGSTQQRLKSELELLAERRSIEDEIRRIVRERGAISEKYGSIDIRLLKQMQTSYNKLNELASVRLRVEKELGNQTKLLAHEEDETIRDNLKGLIGQNEKRLANLKTWETMVTLERDWVAEQIADAKKLKDKEDQRFDRGMAYVAKLGDIFKLQQAHYSNLKASTNLQGKQLMLASSLLAVFEMMFDVFKKMDESLAKFRISMGLMRSDAERISTSIKEVATQFAHVGVTVEGAANATAALANEFGGTMKVSQDLVETTALLKAQLGVAEESSAGFLRNISALSNSTAQTQRHMAFVASALSAAAGVPLNLVMQDVAKLSGNALTMISKMPFAIVKSAVAARQMGTTINKMADASANLLNFTESVQAEMEASVLVGEAINLQRARQLAYEGKIVESTKAILAEARRINFEKLDFFQMQAFATASGRSADELLRMIQAQKQLQEARGIDGLKDEVALYEKLQGQRDSDLKDRALQTELQVKQMANQARIDQLQQQWNQLWMETMRVMFPVFDILLQMATMAVRIGPPILFVAETMEKLFSISAKVTTLWTELYNGIFMAAVAGGKLASIFMRGAEFVGLIGSKLAFIGKIFSVLKFAAPFAKAIPVIGWIITAFQLIGSAITHFKKFMSGEESFGTALGGIIYDVFLKPFVQVWDWIKGIFIGHSPSQLGLGIVKGIIGVQAMIFDALTYPWRHFLAWVADKIPGMGGLAKKLRGGFQGGLEDAGVLEKKAATPETTPLAVAPEAAVAPTTTISTVPSPEEKAQRDQDSTSLANILAAINQLNASLSGGKIGVYIDGQLMSAQISRQTAFRGGYGMNQV